LVTTRTQIPYGPSNFHLIDVSTDTPKWIGAVTLGHSPIDGVRRGALPHGERSYVLTMGQGKGLQVIDLATAKDNLTAIQPKTPKYYEMLEDLGVEGHAFGLNAIVSTIFIDTGAGDNSQQSD